MTNIDENREFIPVHIAVMTVSDSRDMSTDKSGDILSDRVREAGHHLADRVIVQDEKSDIIAQLERWIADPKIDVVISTGGTGLTGRDVTPEAFQAVFEKEIDGFSAIFHRISFEKIGGGSDSRAAISECRPTRPCMRQESLAAQIDRCPRQHRLWRGTGSSTRQFFRS